jgi:hypothetical protein
MPSDSIAELPEKAAATNFVNATATFPQMAATMAVFDADFTFVYTKVCALIPLYLLPSAKKVLSEFCRERLNLAA